MTKLVIAIALIVGMIVFAIIVAPHSPKNVGQSSDAGDFGWKSAVQYPIPGGDPYSKR